MYYVKSTNAWNQDTVYAFTTKAYAEKFLNTEQADFRDREIVDRKEAAEIVGGNHQLDLFVDTCADEFVK